MLTVPYPREQLTCTAWVESLYLRRRSGANISYRLCQTHEYLSRHDVFIHWSPFVWFFVHQKP